ncbi:MAG: D-glycero-beta-D-manno-heptose 1-phosphate adenylyltransferase [Bdellovibrionales bacterium]|nr:D-glycero-beta-D-manno-heptose 1-phosphate adenylyltransferase [Bdellovibrionales bacterium]
MGQVVSKEELVKLVQQDRSKLGPIVFTNGCFDILHVGHIRYLNQARALGATLIVGVNSDASVRGLKGPERPLQTEGDRAEVLAALGCVSFVTIFGEETPLKLIEAISPDILVKGGDWPPEKIVGSSFVLNRGGQVKSLPFVAGRSTSSVVEKIKRL